MDSNGFQVGMVGMDEALNDPNGQYLGNFDMDSEPTVEAIPDLDQLTSDIYEVLAYLEQPDIKKICEQNDSIVRINLINKYADRMPLHFIDLFMTKDEDKKNDAIERALDMIDKLAEVKFGKRDIKKFSKEWADTINYDFVYAKAGGKENFEKELMKEISKGKKVQAR